MASTVDSGVTPDEVLLTVENHVATLTLNRPENRNAMTTELLRCFQDQVEKVKSRQDVRVVIVEGSGKTFCSGADFKAMNTPAAASKSGGKTTDFEDRAKQIYSRFLSLLDLEVPTIAKVNGHAIGGGLGLALVCDLRVVSRQAKLGVNFTRLGLSPGMATTYMLPRLIGLPKAAELFYTGRIFDGELAERIGLANYACDREDIDHVTSKLATEIAGAGPLAVRLTKKALHQGSSLEPRLAMEYESGYQAQTIQ